MSKRHQKTLSDVFSRPVSGTIKWSDIESMFIALGAEVHEREGSRVAVLLKGEKKIFHRPHPRPTTDKGAVNSIRIWLESLGVKP
ncbi:type II toxin-antitoxin system HicA family toxin [Salmonella enterica]|uniref:Type II toxin-antitoxin system HicA family toxin n=1 Tax=Salmonella enterica TaxID=28901 RepID=A0A624QB52_SALER|nr:type II toxin-antitoxin system HicA family toxin [Salmonella enterica]ATI90377.1 type II toxin-antitoxin system HicA family toxin [Salmonella enterica subsp. enterica]EAA8034702.1 type II toxin-antitoxin system HicA family toxin [Salmonella enterica subsp. enterica serovar Duisburg]ECH8181604.1 type II toxin-antitoxin system HicA family toxin [Salmonella enterica subsp. enterica serovar Rissen]EEJ1462952.1 type II toxin-antitoxin system HicA family toxin [Salmonella enterica subsp. enterica 